MCPQMYAMLWLEDALDVLVTGTLQRKYCTFPPRYFSVSSIASRAHTALGGRGIVQPAPACDSRHWGPELCPILDLSNLSPIHRVAQQPTGSSKKEPHHLVS